MIVDSSSKVIFDFCIRLELICMLPRELQRQTETMRLAFTLHPARHAALRLLLLYSESLMVVLHLWILIGVSLPDLENMTSLPTPARIGYLLSDACQPLLVAAFFRSSAAGQSFPSWWMVAICLAAHTLLYAAFAWDEANMEGVTAWAYSPWSVRADLPMLPGAAVCLDAMCHWWGLSSLLRWTNKNGNGFNSDRAALTACAVGAAVGACAMARLSR